MPAKALSTHVVLMDFQQGMCGGGNYCVHRHGGLSQLRKLAGKVNDGSAAAWPAGSFDRERVESIAMRDPRGNDLSGEIAKLTYRASLESARRSVAP